MRRILTIAMITLCFSMFSALFSVDIVYGFSHNAHDEYVDPGVLWEAEEADGKDGWQEVSDSEAYPLSGELANKAMMVPGETTTRQNLSFSWEGEAAGEVAFIVRLKVSDNSSNDDVALIEIAYLNSTGTVRENRFIKANEFNASDTYQHFFVKTEIPEDIREIEFVVSFEPNPMDVDLHCDFVIVSPNVYPHTRIAFNALDLLRRDGHDVEADIVSNYMKDVQGGLYDADGGPAYHGHKYNYWENPQIPIELNVTFQSLEKELGGFCHYFEAWDHKGIGVSEDFERLYMFSPYPPFPWLEEIFGIEGVKEAMSHWRAWQGANAAESARRNFDRAVQAWEAGDEEKAMYFLGYVLHLIEDLTDPHHSAARMFSGHGGFGCDIVPENLDYYLVDRPGHSSNIVEDHGIYLDDLSDLSDGIYIAGDAYLVDTEAEIEALRHGHITQLSDSIYQFCDFAAHEAIEWYPLVNDKKETHVYLDNWWDEEGEDLWIVLGESPNYIETRNDLKMKTVNGHHVPFSSSLIFHFEGVDWVKAEFTGSFENAYEAIDMENIWSQDLGKVRVYSDYRMNNKIAAYVEEGGLWWGPSSKAETDTLVIETNVTGWGWSDHDCDGWQLDRIAVHDKWNRWDKLPDPLLKPQPWYKTSAGEIGRLPLLDDPLPEREEAQRIAAVHMIDLSSKLCAGVIKHFFDEVDLPRGGPPPQTSLVPASSVGWIPRTYMDEYGRIYVRHGQDYGCTDSFELKATLYQSSWDYEEGKLIEEPVEDELGIGATFYKIDDGDWSVQYWLPGFYEVSTQVDIPLDDSSHIIQYYSVTHKGKFEDTHSEVVIWDQSAPTISISIGEPKVLTDVGLDVTEETPIHVNAVDGGSGVDLAKVKLYLTPYPPPYPPPNWPHGELPDPVYTYDRGPEATFTLEYHVLGLPRGFWRIEVGAADRVGNVWVEEIPRVDVVEFIEGVDVWIDPSSATVEPGSSVEYALSIRNRYQTSQTYDLTLEGLDPNWCTLPQPSVTIDPDETEDVTLTVSPPYVGQMMDVYPFTVTATLQGSSDVSDSADALLGIVYEPDLPPQPEGDIAVAVVPDLIGTHVGSDVTVDVEVVNNENFDDLIQVEIGVEDIPEQYQAELPWFSWTEQSLFIPAGTYMTIPLTISIPEAGFEEYRSFDATAESAAWTSIATARACIILDETPPTTTLDIGSPKYVDATGNVYVTSDTSFELTALDNAGGSGVADTWYRIYSGSYNSGWMTSALPITLKLTGLEEGAYNIDFYSTDNAGNVESTNTETIILDNTPPTITINSPTAEDYPHSETLLIDFNVIDIWSGVASVSAELDGSPVGEGDLIDLLTLTLNSHTLAITAVDNLGHATTASVTFNVIADVDSLIDLVERFYENGQIGDPEVRDGLLDKLYAAKALIEAGKTGPARNILRAFIRQVEAQLDHHITEEEASILLADAEYAIEHL